MLNEEYLSEDSKGDNKEDKAIDFGTQVIEKGKVTIVAISAEVNDQIISRCFNLGIVQVFKKPMK